MPSLSAAVPMKNGVAFGEGWPVWGNIHIQIWILDPKQSGDSPRKSVFNYQSGLERKWPLYRSRGENNVMD